MSKYRARPGLVAHLKAASVLVTWTSMRATRSRRTATSLRSSAKASGWVSVNDSAIWFRSALDNAVELSGDVLRGMLKTLLGILPLCRGERGWCASSKSKVVHCLVEWESRTARGHVPVSQSIHFALP